MSGRPMHHLTKLRCAGPRGVGMTMHMSLHMTGYVTISPSCSVSIRTARAWLCMFLHTCPLTLLH